jgi:hypothetical protein
MTLPTATFTTHDMIGIREDLSNTIYDISPLDTPFLSMARKTEATNTLHEWQTDSLAQANAANFVIEGDDATTDASVATVRLGNYTCISDKVARVSGTSRSVNTAGRADELDYQVMKRANELKRDMEAVLTANNAKVAGSDIAARETAGIPAWINTNTDFNTSDGADPTGDGTDARTDGTQRAFVESQLKTVCQKVAESGGDPTVLMTGTYNRQIASSFQSGNTVTQAANDEVLRTSFKIYESDFGQLKMVYNRFMRARDAFVLDMDYWAIAYMPGRNMVTYDLAKTGDSDRKQILCEYALQASNESASGGIFDLTTA